MEYYNHRLLFIMCFLMVLGSCVTNAKQRWVFVEDFRSDNKTDDEIIQEAVNKAGPAGTIYFEPGRVYVLENRVLVKESQTLIGNNATLKRAPQTYSHLSKVCHSSSDSLVVDSIPPGWSIGDQLQIFTDAWSLHSNTFGDYHKLPNIITKIENNKIFLSSSIGSSLDGTINTWPAGATVRKVFTLLRGDSIQYRSGPFSVFNMNFDGNKDENDLNYYWNVNSTIFVRGIGTKLDGCRFYNIPNENIVGHGIYISNCQAEGLNGSFIHFSGVDTVSRILQKHSVVIGNYVNGVCMLSTRITGHSEGAFTTSYNGGFATIANNRVYNCGEAAVGIIDAPYDIADGGKSEFIITGNLFKNCRKIVYGISYVESDLKPSTDIYVADNIFSNCGINDWTESVNFKQYVGFNIGDNSVTNGTVWKY